MYNLEIKFSEIFHRKHGNSVFQDIIRNIKNEIEGKCNKDYIDIIFTIAFLTYFGVDDKKISYFLEDVSSSKSINISKIKSVHKSSISQIQKYIRNANNETLKKYNK